MTITAIKLTAEHPDLSLTELPFADIGAAFREGDARSAAGQRVSVLVVYSFDNVESLDVSKIIS